MGHHVRDQGGRGRLTAGEGPTGLPRGANTRVILGSSSKIRRKLMDELCEEVGENLLRYDVLTADIDEKAIRRKDPSELVTVQGQGKGRGHQEKNEVVAGAWPGG